MMSCGITMMSCGIAMMSCGIAMMSCGIEPQNAGHMICVIHHVHKQGGERKREPQHNAIQFLCTCTFAMVPLCEQLLQTEVDL